MQLSAAKKAAATTADDPISSAADDPISSAAHPASTPTPAAQTPTSAVDTLAQTPISTVQTSAQTPVIQMAQLANTNVMPMRPELPCDNAGQWKLLQILMTKPLPDVKSLKSVMTKWSGYKVHLYGVRAMFHYYPETLGTFFSTTLPFIIKCALQLKTLVAAAEVGP